MLMQFAQSAKRWGDLKADLGLFAEQRRPNRHADQTILRHRRLKLLI